MKVRDVRDFLNKLYPFSNSCQWDNCGLLVGDEDKDVKRIGFALDLTSQVLKEAISINADLVITHHPVIFEAEKRFLKGNVAYEAAVNQISVISCHTCYDSAEGGVSDILAERIGLSGVEVLETQEKPCCVRVGKICKTAPEKLAKNVSEALKANVRFVNGGSDIETVAVCGGAGGDFIKEVYSYGADAYVTGDIDHHEFLLAEELGITLVAAGHFETENICVAKLLSDVSAAFPESECILLHQKNPVTYISAEE